MKEMDAVADNTAEDVDAVTYAPTLDTTKHHLKESADSWTRQNSLCLDTCSLLQ